jgi:hypothetical protein
MDVRVDLTEYGSGQDRHRELCGRLAGELQELDVESVAATAENTPATPRGVVVVVAGARVVTLRPSREPLSALVERVCDWLRRSPVQRSVRLTLDGDTVELTGASGEPQRRVVADWVVRHAGG